MHEEMQTAKLFSSEVPVLARFRCAVDDWKVPTSRRDELPPPVVARRSDVDREVLRDLNSSSIKLLMLMRLLLLPLLRELLPVFGAILVP